jgi:hypothetical protein
VGQLALPFAPHIRTAEVHDHWLEICADRLVAISCPSAMRAVVAWAYLQLRGLDRARILDYGY